MRDALERPNVLRALTGLDPEEFHRLSAVFTEEWERETERNWEGQPRHYPKGVGPKGALDTTEVKLLFILMYLRVYPTQEVMGFFYGFNQCQANKWIMRLLPVLRRALERLAALPVRQPAALEQILARCQDLKLRLDGVERPIRRPKDPEKPRGHELSPLSARFNQVIASVRVEVEHVIGGIKRWRIVSDVFRNIKTGLADLVMLIACGLHNLVEECRAPIREASNNGLAFSV